MTKRRQFLKTSIAATVGAALAGCTGGDGGDGGDGGGGGGGGGDGGGGGGATPTSEPTVSVDSDVQSIVDSLPDYYPGDYAQTVQKAKDEGTLTIYTAYFGSFSESVFLEGLKSKFPFLDIQIVNLPTAKVFERFATEASQDVWEPDLVHTYDAVALSKMDQLGILRNYDSPEKQMIRDDYISESGNVVAQNMNPYADAWNPSELPQNRFPPSKSLEGIAQAVSNDPDYWNGNVAIYDGVLSTSMWQTMRLWDEIYGRETMVEHLEVLAQANPKAFWSTSTMGKWVATGEVKYGVGLAEFILDNFVRPDYGEDALQWGPADDVVATIFMGGYQIPKEASNLNTAKIAFDWFNSQEGQLFLNNNWNMVSARTDMADVVENTYAIPGGSDVPLTLESVHDLTDIVPTYRALSTAGALKTELKNLWYEIFVAG